MRGRIGCGGPSPRRSSSLDGSRTRLPRFDPRPEFTLEAIEGGTRLLVVESGFSRVREDRRGSAWKDNDDGWTHELGELKTYLEAA